MGSTVVAATYKQGLRGCNSAKRFGGRVCITDVRGIIRRADNDKIIIHDFTTVRAISCGDKCLFRFLGVYQNRIYIACLSQSDGLTGSHDQKLHFKPQIRLDCGQQFFAKSRIIKRCRYSHPHHFGIGMCGK